MAKDSMEKTSEISAVVDRIEDGDWAVISAGEDETQFDFPATLLPKAAREEGAYLHIRITVDEEARATAEDRTAELLEKLEKRSAAAKGKKDFKL
jgi:hypothetical protein